MPRLSSAEYAELLANNPDLAVEQDGADRFGDRSEPDISMHQNSGKEYRFVTIKEPMNRSMSEHDDQVILFDFLKILEVDYPVLEYVLAIPNGGYRPPKVAKDMKAEGQRPGVPDIWVPLPMGNKFGMVIEMKRGYLKSNGTKGSINKPSDDQVRWLNMMHDINWLAFVAYHRETARQLILRYCKVPDIQFYEVL